MPRLFVILLLLMLPVVPAKAEQPTQERILRLFEVTGVVGQTEGLIQQMLPVILKQIGPPIVRAARAQKRQVPPDFNQILHDEAQKAFGELSFEILVALVPVYQQSFSVEEVETLIEFYETDLGQRTIRAWLEMQPTAARIGQKLGVEKGRELVINVLERLPKADESLN